MTLTALDLPKVPGASGAPRPTTSLTPRSPTGRWSLTDRCNPRCSYCMPAEGLDCLPGEQLLRPRPEVSSTANGMGLGALQCGAGPRPGTNDPYFVQHDRPMNTMGG